ncbi:MAG: hypothetical protein FJX70_07520 [Alphaproteobacteria bacterium]|nr:hypothetical protein [Alphaproteobacteria bacterium]
MDWTQLSSIITVGTGIVIAGATWEIMKLNNSQTKIAEQKQKDDLFKIRWEFYDEIVKIINQFLLDLKCPIYKDLNNPNVKSKIEQEDKAKYLLYLAVVKLFKNKARWLFDEELAIWLEVQLMNGSYSKYEQYKEEETPYFWFPDEGFTKKFDKYLKLK